MLCGKLTYVISGYFTLLPRYQLVLCSNGNILNDNLVVVCDPLKHGVTALHTVVKVPYDLHESH